MVILGRWVFLMSEVPLYTLCARGWGLEGLVWRLEVGLGLRAQGLGLMDDGLRCRVGFRVKG